MRRSIRSWRRELEACVVAATALLEPSALGQPVSSPPAPVSLVVDLEPGAQLDPERLRGAIAAELGLPVTWERNGGGGTLAIRQIGARVVVSFDAPGGRHDGRGIPLGPEPRQAERDIVLLAGNVARDQTAQFEPRPAPAAPLPAPPSSPSPSPESPATPPEAPPPRSPCDPVGPRLAVGVDFTPWLGVSTADRGRSIRSFSLGALGSLSGGVHGLAVSGLVDVDRGAMCGLQVSGLVSLAGESSGVQLSGLVNVAPRFDGAQIAGIVNDSGGDSSGLQVATVNLTRGRVAGAQVGVFNYARDADFQFGLVNVNTSGRLRVDAWANVEVGLLLAGLKNGGAHYHWIYALGL